MRRMENDMTANTSQGDVKYVIRLTHKEFMSAGEVVKETSTGYIVKSVEGCPCSHVGGRFPKDEIVFVSSDKAKLIRLMSLYIIVSHQHRAVIDAATKAYHEALDVIVAQKACQASVSTLAAQNSSPT